MQLCLFIFDWSGVISDDRRPVYESNMKLLEHYGKPTMSFEEWRKRTTLTPVEFLRNHGVTEKMADDREIWNLYRKEYDNVTMKGIAPEVYHDARDALEFLKNKNKTVSILSSHPEENLLREAEEYGLKIFIDSISGSAGKDKARGLKRTLERFSKNPKDALYTGDTFLDIIEAKKAGTYSAGICNGYHSRERLAKEEPDFLFENLSEIKRLEIF